MPPDHVVQAHHFEAMGTSCSVFAISNEHGRLLEGESWVRTTAARLTRFSPDSEVVLLNGATGRWVEVSAEMEDLLRESLRAFELSRGLVNIAVLPSMLAIGYTRPLSQGTSAPMLGRALPLPALPEVLEVRAGRAWLARGCAIDLGGVAKGWMADRLRERMGRNAVANLGGDLSAGGAGPRGDGWPVGITSAGVTVLLRDHGAATSSVRRRQWDGLHHLIDPRTGMPADSGLEEVSVVAGTGFEAEVLAKTALLAGPDIGRAFCAAHAVAWWLDARPVATAAAAGGGARS